LSDTCTSDPPFVHLDVRSCFSLKEGAFTPEQLVSRAALLGMPAVAICDRDGLYGAARFVKACEEQGVKPILGASLTVRGGGPPPDDGKAARRVPKPPGRRDADDTHIVLLAQDAVGYSNLCRLITDAHMLGERSDPSVTASQVCAHAAGLVALLGPTSAPGRLAVAGRIDAASQAVGEAQERPDVSDRG
jgi:error-prone DNA polymerase